MKQNLSLTFYQVTIKTEHRVGDAFKVFFLLPGEGCLSIIKCSKIKENNKLIMPMHVYGDADISTQIAFSLIKQIFSKEKFGLHFVDPETSIGPSAGISSFCSMFSAVTDIPTPVDTGMTGGLNPDGTVYAISYIPEKMTAIANAGLRKVVLSKGNEIDFDEWKEENPDIDLTPIFVENIYDVIKAVFPSFERKNIHDTMKSSFRWFNQEDAKD